MKKLKLATVALLVAGGLSAADRQASFGLKMRAQGGLQTEDGMRNGFGFGGSFAMPLGPGELAAELGYQYFSGSQYLEPIKPGPYPLSSANSIDSRKNSADGLALRLSFGMPISQGWGWQIGGSVSKLKGRHESTANWGAAAAYGGWAMVSEKSAITLSPFAGLTFDLSERGRLELNALLASYKMPTVEPGYPAGATGFNRVVPVYGDKSINKLKIELTYGFRF
jgi:hypothetical protein